MTASQQITFQPTFALMLTQHFHDPTIGCDVVVAGKDLRGRAAIRRLKHRAPAIRVVSSGLKTRKLAGLCLITSRMNSP